MRKSILLETQCHACDARIHAGVFFCKVCGRSRGPNKYFQFKPWEILLTIIATMVCLCGLGISVLAPIIFISRTSTPTKIATTETLVLYPSSTPMITPTSMSDSFTLVPSSTVTELPLQTSTPDYYAGDDCPGAPFVKVQVNDLVIVITSNTDRLVFRSKPILNKSTELERLDYGSFLKIHDGPVCVEDPSDGRHYWFWEVKDKATGMMGWVADGNSQYHFIKKAK